MLRSETMFINSWDSEMDVDQLIRDHDETYMPLPDIESEPHLLISKVRKHYMEHMIKLLSANYETNQRLVNKNIYLPSAIWKCAKNLEMKAAQACMVVQLYRKCIVTVINEIKTTTKKGRLYNKLYESLHHEAKNEKRTQTVVSGDNCQCYDKKRRRKKSAPMITNTAINLDLSKRDSLSKRVEEISALLKENHKLTNYMADVQKIPVVTNTQIDHIPQVNHLPKISTEEVTTSQPHLDIPQAAQTPKTTEKEPDELMHQMELLFQSEDKDDDDLFTSTLTQDNTQTDQVNTTQDCSIGSSQDLVHINTHNTNNIGGPQVSIIENHAAQIKSLDQRLATLTGLLVNNEPLVQPQKVQPVKKAKHTSKWICEEFFLKKNLYELLYEIGDINRFKLARIKNLYKQLFGDDSDDDEGILSPDETPEFVASCKARIDSWVMSVLAPYYSKGRIQGKALYKSVAKHLIELIYKCKQYPSENEVTSFVMDFLETRGKIRCEADFKEFRINNVVPNYY